MKIYTKTGDKGSSSLFTGERRSKADAIFEALGNTDELNAHLGLAKVAISHSDLLQMLTEIQCRLLDAGSCIATPPSPEESALAEAKRARVQFNANNTASLETWIDELDAGLPPLRNFILPGGGEGSARLHVARTICRKAERSLVPLLAEEQLDSNVYTYLNRLSDLLFVMARTVASRDGHTEEPYQKRD